MALASYLPQTLHEAMRDQDDDNLCMYEGLEIKQEPGVNNYMASKQGKIYMDLSACNMVLHKHTKTEFPEQVNSLLSWTTKHPENWECREVLDWVYYVAEEHKFDGAIFRGEAYQNISGAQLSRMSRDQMHGLDPHYGSQLYDLFRRLFDNSRFQEPPQPDTLSPETYTSIYDASSLLAAGPGALCDGPDPSGSTSDLSELSVFVDDSGVQVDLAGHVYDIDMSAKLDFLDTELIDCGYVSGDSDMDGPSSDLRRCDSNSSDIYDNISTSDEEDPASPKSSNFPLTLYASNSLRQAYDFDDGCVSCSSGRPEPKRRTSKRPSSTSKGNHLWEFIRDLLKDSKFNPSLLRWEDKDAGVFKFVQSEAVANMWGRKKNNPAMTYEKLSRAMRFCRTAGYFDEVPKNGKFPKKLCFKFGTKAYGWKD